jgi:diguanylate cyclase (GGDEF)-like protein
MTGHNILIVDDDPGTIKVIAGILSDVARLRVATSGKDALRLARESTPDLILLDAEMDDMTGFEVCETLKADPELADVSVIFVTNHCEAAFQVAGFEMGAADFIAKPFSAPLVRARVKTQLRVKRLTDDLRRVAAVDALTGVANRRHFDDSLEREWLRAWRACEPIALLLINVDHFEFFNEHYGYVAGDECLRTVAQAVETACMRAADLVARLGGGEFAVLLPQTPRAGAEHVTSRILEAMEALEIPHQSSPARHVTVSIGVGYYDETSKCWSETPADGRLAYLLRERGSASKLLLTASNALHAGKRSGCAQARLLDVADAEDAAMASTIEMMPQGHDLAEPV